MDYATTFCDYAGLKTTPRRTAARRFDMFPPALSLRTIATISAAMQLAGLWFIFACGFLAVANDGIALQYISAAALPAALLGMCWCIAGQFSARQLAEPQRRPRRSFLTASFAAALVTILVLAAVEQHFNIASVGVGCLAAVMVLLLALNATGLSRQFVHHAVKRQRLACEIVIAGEPKAMRSFIQHMREHHASVRISAAFVLAPGTAGGEIDGVPLAGGISDLLNYHTSCPEPRVVLMTTAGGGLLDAHLAALKMQPLHVLAVSEIFGKGRSTAQICAAGVPGVRLIPLQAPPLRAVDHLIKSVFDRLAGIIALILFAPVMLACAALIKLTSPGPVLYRQKRIGYRNSMFNVYKFRSMHISACDKLTLTQRGDARVFAFGKLMRKLSLDELPQLFNVVRGEMSLVGPRPHMREARAGAHLYYDIVPDYASRHRVKPGITGWAQINGWRGPTETDQAIRARVEHDLYYIENWSFWLDIKILFRTVAGGFSGSNAF